MITGSLVLAVLFVLISIAALFCAPIPIGEQFFWAALKDIGPAIAGSWVLSAGLLTLTWISQTRAGQGGEPGHQRVF